MQNDGEIYLEGKKYISSKRAAKFTGYTHDYIGQLSRAGKVEGRVVGKTRFVEEDSILDYKKNNNGVKKENGILKEDSWEKMLFGKVSDAIKNATIPDSEIQLTCQSGGYLSVNAVRWPSQTGGP